MTATATMPKKPKKGAGKKPRFTMLLRLDGETAAALAEYIAAQDVAPKRNPVIVQALREFLRERDFWPPKPTA